MRNGRHSLDDGAIALLRKVAAGDPERVRTPEEIQRAKNRVELARMAKKAAKKPAKKKAPRKDASQTALSIVEQVTGGKLKLKN
jgi:hypothetical protein